MKNRDESLNVSLVEQEADLLGTAVSAGNIWKNLDFRMS